jgi:hypothetical protein
MAEMKTQLSEAQATIKTLVTKTGNLQRSNHYIKEKQDAANVQILKSQENLTKETQKLYHQKFWFNLKARAAENKILRPT